MRQPYCWRHHAPPATAPPSTSETRARAFLSLCVVDGGNVELKTTGVYTVDVVEEDGALRFKRMQLDLDAGF